MAKLSSYYTLCPLIDQQSLLGVEKDADPACAIVTLGRNIVIRYKLQDLKQVSSWSSKERLTTQVTYDKKTSRYTAVFNEKYVRVWSGDETDLDKVKRYKFNFSFCAILTLEDSSPVLVRQDGATASLNWALENRKSWSTKGILKANEKLLNGQLVSVNERTYLCALTKYKESHSYIVVGLRRDNCLEDAEHSTRIELKRTSENLVGHVILQDKSNAYLLTLWSHGRLYSYPLVGSCSTPVPGMLVSVVTAVNTKHPVVMVALNESTIAAYGADVDEEGAVLLIYNVQFKLVQALQRLKLYTRDAKLWRIEDKLLLAANRHLAIAPYRLSSQRIESMLGSSLRFKSNDDNDEVMVIQESTVAHWQEQEQEQEAEEKVASLTPRQITLEANDHISRIIGKEITALLNEGASDATIHRNLVPQLIESKDVKTIVWCLDNFADLSEKLLIDILSFCLRTPDATFASMQNGGTLGDSLCKTRNILVHSRHTFLDRLFISSFTDSALLSYLKSDLNFNEIIRLTSYLIEKLSADNGDSVDEVNAGKPDDKRIYEWTSLLLDSHYQNYLLSQDPGVLKLLNKLTNLLDDHFQLLREIENLRPMLSRIINGKSVKPNAKDFNKFYSIEEVQLY